MKKVFCLFSFAIAILATIIGLTSCGTSSLAKIGMDKNDCLELFKEDQPAYNIDEKKYYWYDDDFYALFTKYDIDLKNETDQLSAITSALESNSELRQELSNLSFRYRFVAFDDEDKLAEFYYDFDHKFDLSDDYSCFKQKEIEKLSFSKSKLEYYVEQSQFKNNKNKNVYKINIVDYESISYSISFVDGTIYKAKLSDAIENGTEVIINKNSNHTGNGNNGKKSFYGAAFYLDIDNLLFNSQLKVASDLLKNIKYDSCSDYIKDIINYEGIPNNVSCIGIVKVNKDNQGNVTSKEILDWDRHKIKYIPSDIETFSGEMTEKTYKNVIYKGTPLNEFYEVVDVVDKTVKSIEINPLATVIKRNALCGLNNIFELEIPEGVTEIEDGAINNNKNMVGLILPETLERIGEYNFFGCPKLLQIANKSSIYTEEMAKKVLVDGAGYFYTKEEYEQINNKNIYHTVDGRNGTKFVFAHLENTKFNAIETGWYLISVIGSQTSLTLPSTPIRFTDTTESVNEYSIYNYAFDGNTELKEIVIPDNVKTIGSYAFRGCTTLENVILNSAETIDDYAFKGCTSLKNIAMDNTKHIGDFVFEGCTNLESASMKTATYLGNYAFGGCTKLAEINIEELTEIGPSAFYNCRALTEVNAPKLQLQRRVIDEYNYHYEHSSSIFSGCTSLTTVSLAETTFIPYNTFYNCRALTDVNIPKVTQIEGNAFYNCEMLENLTTGELYQLDNYSFYNCKKLATVTISDDINYIYGDPFYGCTSLVFNVEGNYKYLASENNNHAYLYDVVDKSEDTLVLENDIRVIREQIFVNYPNLKHLTVQDNIEYYNLQNILNMCSNLEYELIDNCYYLGSVNNSKLAIVTVDKTKSDITIDEDVKYIMPYAFKDSNITSINIPNNVTYIGYQAFDNTKITELDLSNYNNSMDSSIFSNNKELVSAIVWSNDSDMFSNCTSLENVTINGGISSHMFYGCTSLTTVTTPNNSYIYYVNYGAFEGCIALENIDLSNVSEILDRAFYNCVSLKNIDLSNVTRIDSYAFYGCTNLEVEDLDKVTTISDYAFYNCNKLNVRELFDLETIGSYAFYNTSIAEAVIDNCETIGIGAFKNCSELTNIELGSRLTFIGDEAFSGCAKLVNMNIPDAVETLGNKLFDQCAKLSYVMIPDAFFKGLLSVFNGCPTSTNIYYNGTYEKLYELGFRKSMLELNQKVYFYSEDGTNLDSDLEYWHYNDNDEIVIWNKN